MLNWYILDELRNPVPLGGSFMSMLLRWAEWADANRGAIRVALTKIGPFTVSTIFMGMDHSYKPDLDTPPLLFETMVFCADPDNPDRFGERGEMRRCSTWAQAEEQHALMVSFLEKVAQEIK